MLNLHRRHDGRPDRGRLGHRLVPGDQRQLLRHRHGGRGARDPVPSGAQHPPPGHRAGRPGDGLVLTGGGAREMTGPARRRPPARGTGIYPEKVLADLGAWLRGHPWQADGLLAAALFALSAPQLSAGTTRASLRVAYIAVTALLAATVIPRR